MNGWIDGVRSQRILRGNARRFFRLNQKRRFEGIRAIEWGMEAIPQRLWKRVGTPFDCLVKL